MQPPQGPGGPHAACGMPHAARSACDSTAAALWARSPGRSCCAAVLTPRRCNVHPPPRGTEHAGSRLDSAPRAPRPRTPLLANRLPAVCREAASLVRRRPRSRRDSLISTPCRRGRRCRGRAARSAGSQRQAGHSSPASGAALGPLRPTRQPRSSRRRRAAGRRLRSRSSRRAAAGPKVRVPGTHLLWSAPAAAPRPRAWLETQLVHACTRQAVGGGAAQLPAGVFMCLATAQSTSVDFGGAVMNDSGGAVMHALSPQRHCVCSAGCAPGPQAEATHGCQLGGLAVCWPKRVGG